jgi:hypothetical protein
MRRYGMSMAISLLIVVNAVVLGGIAYNRSGEPTTTITLTEREIPLSYASYSDRENTGLSLRLEWETVGTSPEGYSSPGKRRRNDKKEWFDKAKLESIGFNCSMPLDATGAEDHYQKMLPRKTYVVLEYEGAAWESWLADAREELAESEREAQENGIAQEKLINDREQFDLKYRTHSRLFLIDVANDSNALRRKYADKQRYLVLPAKVRMIFYQPMPFDDDFKEEPPRLQGEVSDILVDTLSVPKAYRPILEKRLRRTQKHSDKYKPEDASERGPAYEATIHIGKRSEPWIASIREINPDMPKQAEGR